MPQNIVNRLATAASIAAGATARYQLGVVESEYYLAGYEEIVLLADLNVGAGVESVVFTFEVSPDGTTWFTAPLHSLLTTTASNIQAASVTRTADTTAAIAALRVPAPYVRAVVVNGGASAAVLTLWSIIT
jgi:hypothetical protein